MKKQPEIRIWHAGCATGEEVLSMSILLHEEGLSEKSVIYATDMNTNVLEKAKQGILPLNKMQTYTKTIYKLAVHKRFLTIIQQIIVLLILIHHFYKTLFLHSII